MKANFLQFSHKLTSPVNPVADYYKAVWSKIDGYHISSEHYLELPAWVAEVSGYLDDKYWDKEFTVLTSDSGADLIASPGVVYFGSVLDVSLPHWHNLINSAPLGTVFILGGYVDPSEFAAYHHVIWVDSPAGILTWLGGEFPGVRSGPPDYTLFSGQSCIPRLQLSTGCLYKCAFCTVPRKVEPLEWCDVLPQVLAWQPLTFEYVYLDDKTWGQSPNWRWIELVYDRIKEYNPGFKGFIVQTTAHEVYKHAEDWVTNYHVKAIEIGVESYYKDILAAWRKPHGLRHIDKAVDTIRDLVNQGHEVYFIPNLIFGIDQDLYDHDVYADTIAWVGRNLDVITFVNPYILCVYWDSKGEPVGNSDGSALDADETTWDKSWLSREDQEAASRAFEQVLRLTQLRFEGRPEDIIPDLVFYLEDYDRFAATILTSEFSAAGWGYSQAGLGFGDPFDETQAELAPSLIEAIKRAIGLS